MKALMGTQGGGSAVYDQLQQGYVFVTPPDWMKECKAGDAVPSEWSIGGRIGLYSDVPVEQMEPAEREGYEVGVSGKADNRNRYLPTSEFHTEWAAGYERGLRERAAYDGGIPCATCKGKGTLPNGESEFSWRTCPDCMGGGVIYKD